MKHITLALAAVVCMSGESLAQDLVEAGQKVFNKCKACHMVGDGAKNRVGPQLNNIYGRQAGTIEGFKYSDVMVALGEAGLNWDAETMSGYVGNPKKWLVEIAPEYGLDCGELKKCRGRMAFPGIKDEEDLTALNAYLETFSDSGGDS